MLRNLTDCAAKVSLAEAVARRDGASARSTIRFGAADRAVVSPGERVGGTFSIPLQGDGTYEITATTVTEIGLVR